LAVERFFAAGRDRSLQSNDFEHFHLRCSSQFRGGDKLCASVSKQAFVARDTPVELPTC
jgi:hypothetical protein